MFGDQHFGMLIQPANHRDQHFGMLSQPANPRDQHFGMLTQTSKTQESAPGNAQPTSKTKGSAPGDAQPTSKTEGSAPGKAQPTRKTQGPEAENAQPTSKTQGSPLRDAKQTRKNTGASSQGWLANQERHGDQLFGMLSQAVKPMLRPLRMISTPTELLAYLYRNTLFLNKNPRPPQRRQCCKVFIITYAMYFTIHRSSSPWQSLNSTLWHV